MENYYEVLINKIVYCFIHKEIQKCYDERYDESKAKPYY
jgi:hypothetical protein